MMIQTVTFQALTSLSSWYMLFKYAFPKTGNDNKRPQTTTSDHEPPENDHKLPQITSKRPQTTTNHQQTTTNQQQTTTIRAKPNKTFPNSNYLVFS